MPRRSAADIAAERWRNPGLHPQPRRGMSEPARKLWREIVDARPPTFFMTGTQNILRTFVEITILLEQIWPQLSATPDDERILRRMVILANLQVALGSKLRLTVQSVLRGDKAAVFERSQPAGPTPWLLQGKKPWEREDPN
jgi:hypothetical protein